MKILSKYQFYYLYKKGLLGNSLRQFSSFEEAYHSDVERFGLREMGIAGGGLHLIVPRADLADTLSFHAKTGRIFNIDEAAPDIDVQLQGELCQTFRGWEGLLGIRTGVRMRLAMASGLLSPYRGITVRSLIDQFCDPSTRDDIDGIFDLYPDATIEFATYPYLIGKIPGRNTIIWEIRNY